MDLTNAILARELVGLEERQMGTTLMNSAWGQPAGIGYRNRRLQRHATQHRPLCSHRLSWRDPARKAKPDDWATPEA